MSNLSYHCVKRRWHVYLHLHGMNDKTMWEHAGKNTYDRPSASLVTYLERNKRKGIDRNRERQDTKLKPRWMLHLKQSKMRQLTSHWIWIMHAHYHELIKCCLQIMTLLLTTIYVFTIPCRFRHKGSTLKSDRLCNTFPSLWLRQKENIFKLDKFCNSC